MAPDSPTVLVFWSCASSYILGQLGRNGFATCRSCSGLFELQVPGNIDYHDALIPAYKQKQLQQLSPLVVERSLPPVFDDEFGDKDSNLTIRVVAFDLQDVPSGAMTKR